MKFLAELAADAVIFVIAVVIASGSCVQNRGACGTAKTAAEAARPSN